MVFGFTDLLVLVGFAISHLLGFSVWWVWVVVYRLDVFGGFLDGSILWVNGIVVCVGMYVLIWVCWLDTAICGFCGC